MTTDTKTEQSSSSLIHLGIDDYLLRQPNGDLTLVYTEKNIRGAREHIWDTRERSVSIPQQNIPKIITWLQAHVQP